MIILITGASHTGKTLLAQRLLERYHYNYLSLDLLKMGLIRSGCTMLTPLDDDELTVYLWNIVRKIIRTALENKQNLIVEGGYIPFNWQNDFSENELCEIKYFCLVMSCRYIKNHFGDIKKYANAIEHRVIDDCTLESVLADNAYYFKMCKKYGCKYILINDKYEVDVVF